MAGWEDVRRIALGLPETEETDSRGLPQWKVRGKGFAWERPLRKADYQALGDDAPGGPILGVRTPDVMVKQALVSDDPAVYFTTPHFDGWPAVLVCLEEIPVDELEELIVEAWISQAPKRLSRDHGYA